MPIKRTQKKDKKSIYNNWINQYTRNGKDRNNNTRNKNGNKA